MKFKKLKDYIFENKTRVKNKDIPVFSVTNTNGLVPSSETFNKIVHSKNIANYKEVKPNFFAYNPSRINVGSIAFNINKFSCAVSPMYTVFECNTKHLLPKYLLYFLKSTNGLNEIKNRTTGTVRFQLKFNQLSNLSIFLPSVPEQQRIVLTLEEVDELIKKQKRALKMTRQMIPALFSEMFEYPKDKQEISTANLKDHCLNIKSGFACGKSSKAGSDNILHLRPMNITYIGQLSLSNSKFISSEILSDLESYSIKKNDVLFNNTNSKELVGKSCHISKDLENIAFSNHITRIRPNQKNLDSFFLATQLQILQRKGVFLSMCNKWIGQAGINNQKLSKLSILLPSIGLQKEFSKKAKEIQLLQSQQEKSLRNLEKLLEAILYEAFGK
jgi:type I restriction enzyme, S subunit